MSKKDEESGQDDNDELTRIRVDGSHHTDCESTPYCPPPQPPQQEPSSAPYNAPGTSNCSLTFCCYLYRALAQSRG